MRKAADIGQVRPLQRSTPGQELQFPQPGQLSPPEGGYPQELRKYSGVQSEGRAGPVSYGGGRLLQEKPLPPIKRVFYPRGQGEKLSPGAHGGEPARSPQGA